MQMRSSNPAFGERILREVSFTDESTTMTVNGMVTKTAISLVCVLATAGMAWSTFQNNGNVTPYLYGGGIVGFIVAIATCMRPMWAQYTTPIYALAEGAFLGSISAIIAAAYPQVDIVFQACCLTFGTLFVMLICYQTGVIKVTEKLRAGIIAATGAICLLYLVSFVVRLFGGTLPFIHDSSMLGIGFSFFVVGLAAFNLLLDFDLVDRLVAQRAPKAMEWYAAFALLVTLVWLYLEILRLLSKLQNRR